MTISTLKLQATGLMAAVMLCAAPAFAQVSVSKTTTVTTPAMVAPATILPLAADTTVKTSVTTTEQTPLTTTTKTQWHSEQKTIVADGARVYNPLDFDMNGDKILTTNEVGEKLFKMYDVDGNNIIDNNEYERKAVLTVVPVETNTIISYDFDGDGLADKSEVTSEIFLKRTQLSLFDKNGDGLSPREFTNRGFMKADVNKDKAVDLAEWKGSYNATIDGDNKDKALFNK